MVRDLTKSPSVDDIDPYVKLFYAISMHFPIPSYEVFMETPKDVIDELLVLVEHMEEEGKATGMIHRQMITVISLIFKDLFG